MANGSLLDQPGDRNLVDSLAGNSDNRQAMQRPHGGAAATVTYDQQAHASDPNPWVSSRVVYAFRRDVRFVCFAVVVFGSGHAGGPAVAPGRGSVPGGAVVGGDVVGGGFRRGWSGGRSAPPSPGCRLNLTLGPLRPHHPNE